jgi:hypothetical protein
LKPTLQANAALSQSIQLTDQCRQHIEMSSGYEYESRRISRPWQSPMHIVANDDEAGRPAIGVRLADGVLGHTDLAALSTKSTGVMFDGISRRMRIRSGT